VAFARRGDSALRHLGVGDVASETDTPERLRRRLGRDAVDVEERDFGAGARKRRRGRLPKP